MILQALYRPSTFLILTMMLLSCAATKRTRQLNHHNQLLTRMARDTTLSTDVKLDTLAISLMEMMNEGLNIVNPKKGAAYVETYLEQNDRSINIIFKEISDWQHSMSTAEKVLNGVALTQKPYASEFVDLIKRFERRYKQLKFVAKLLGKTNDLFPFLV